MHESLGYGSQFRPRTFTSIVSNANSQGKPQMNLVRQVCLAGLRVLTTVAEKGHSKLGCGLLFPNLYFQSHHFRSCHFQSRHLRFSGYDINPGDDHKTEGQASSPSLGADYQTLSDTCGLVPRPYHCLAFQYHTLFQTYKR